MWERQTNGLTDGRESMTCNAAYQNAALTSRPKRRRSRSFDESLHVAAVGLRLQMTPGAESRQ